MTQIEVMNQFFFKKVQLQKLTILEYLDSGMVTFSFLEKQSGISKQKIKLLVKDLSEEIQKYCQEYSCTLLIDKEKVYFSLNRSNSGYAKIINILREVYLSESGLFQVLLFVLEIREFSIVNMSSELSYSESYSYKLIGKLKDFFLLLDVDIHLDKKTETIIQLSGDESTIRIFHYLVISFSSKGNLWLFKTITQKEIQLIQSYNNSRKYKNLSYVGKKRIDYIIAIYELALKNNHRMNGIDSAVLELGNTIKRDREPSLYLKRGAVNDNELFEESTHLNFMANYFSQELQTEKEKINLGKLLYSMRKNIIVNHCVELLDMITKQYKLSKRSYYLLLYSLCNRLVVIHYFGFYKFIFLHKSPPIIREIELYIGGCVDKKLNYYSNYPSFEKIKYSFTQVITGYVLLNHRTSQKIYVEFFYRPEYKSILENAIRRNYNSEVLQITEMYSEADIVISDTYTYKNDKLFYFKDVFDQNSWIRLGNYLNQVIMRETLE
ncbi:helix-turn-helix domain-containing protein [Enterococcus faecalis]|nr:helix-turn-helix domain-containing protein [Enterococcus faecalis]